MRKRIAMMGVMVGLMLTMLPLAVLATGQSNVCPLGADQFKWDVEEDVWSPSDPGIEPVVTPDEDGEADAIEVPDGWTIVCAKGGQVVADGLDTQKVDLDKAISHIVIEQEPEPEPEPEPELDCEDEDYATENPDECEQVPVPTLPDLGLAPVPSITDEPATTTEQPATTSTTVARTELPLTGPSDWLIPLAYAGLGMLVAGSLAAWFFRDRLS